MDLSCISDRFGDMILRYELCSIVFDRTEIFLSMTLILSCKFCLFNALSLMYSSSWEIDLNPFYASKVQYWLQFSNYVL